MKQKLLYHVGMTRYSGRDAGMPRFLAIVEGLETNSVYAYHLHGGKAYCPDNKGIANALPYALRPAFSSIQSFWFPDLVQVTFTNIPDVLNACNTTIFGKTGKALADIIAIPYAVEQIFN
jgi:hypothetical protein